MTRILLATLSAALAAAAWSPPSDAQQRREGEGRYNQQGGINYAPAPGVYSVVSIDSYSKEVVLKAQDGRTASVKIGEDVYDLSKLKAGDRIQVDFAAPNSPNDNKLKAATVWPVR